jgi:hypothetical protein
MAIMAAIARRSVEMYDREKQCWSSINPSTPFLVRTGGIVLVRVVGLNNYPEQRRLEIDEDLKQVDLVDEFGSAMLPG